MPAPTIKFRFDHLSAARSAYDTLEELGYRPERLGDGRMIKVHVERADITSALEIAQAFGGELCESGSSAATWNDAYALHDKIAFDGFIPDTDPAYSGDFPFGDDY